jgi:hypothetical protein
MVYNHAPFSSKNATNAYSIPFFVYNYRLISRFRTSRSIFGDFIGETLEVLPTTDWTGTCITATISTVREFNITEQVACCKPMLVSAACQLRTL